ncbi:MAG: hypothetical protein ACYDC8_16920 [Gammaproteobacteria bacterium]
MRALHQFTLNYSALSPDGTVECDLWRCQAEDLDHAHEQLENFIDGMPDSQLLSISPEIPTSPGSGHGGPGGSVSYVTFPDSLFPEKTGGEQVIPFPYCSGMSRPGDFTSALKSGAGIGVEISELSARMMEMVAAAVAAGNQVFVDSGAFRAFRRAQKNGIDAGGLDFDKVMSCHSIPNLRIWSFGVRP